MSQEFAERGSLDRSARKRRTHHRLHWTRFSATKEDDLTVARSKLNNILDGIARGEETFDDEYFAEETNGLTSPIKSKRPRGPRKARKRTREDDYSKSSMFILKLFDRTVDLSQFCNKYIDSDPPLYPICRAWALNNETSEPSPFVDEEQTAINNIETMGYGDNDNPGGIYVLPPPDSKPVDDDGLEIDLRIPRNTKVKKDALVDIVDSAMNSMTDKSVESLLQTNLTGWKSVRQDWREAASLNQSRYKPSFDVIHFVPLEC